MGGHNVPVPVWKGLEYPYVGSHDIRLQVGQTTVDTLQEPGLLKGAAVFAALTVMAGAVVYFLHQRASRPKSGVVRSATYEGPDLSAIPQ